MRKRFLVFRVEILWICMNYLVIEKLDFVLKGGKSWFLLGFLVRGIIFRNVKNFIFVYFDSIFYIKW